MRLTVRAKVLAVLDGDSQELRRAAVKLNPNCESGVDLHLIIHRFALKYT